MIHGPNGEPARDNTPDTESALQKELKRETAEGSGAVGDMLANRNLSGSTMWDTLPVPGADQTQPAEREVVRGVAASADAAGEESRDHVKDEIADRLHRRGVNLFGRETGEELANLLEAVERFEAAVEASGGDLMMDEAIGADAPTEPDDCAFVLPTREASDSVGTFIERVTEATARARTRKSNGGG